VIEFSKDNYLHVTQFIFILRTLIFNVKILNEIKIKEYDLLQILEMTLRTNLLIGSIEKEVKLSHAQKQLPMKIISLK
jgi:hypothetical protein